ncbi:MAG TPA: hypothetical protein VNR90_16410, partial [Vicinamibacterales bacterium]|nr:hypothetical protein [Vicinamibacterales bacterium]
ICGAMQLCDATGHCVGCLSPFDCPLPTSACQERSCDNNVCGFTNKAAGTLVTNVPAGDCHHDECNATGGVITVVDTGDLPSTNGKECLVAACSATGDPSTTPKAAGVACSQGTGTECDGAGECVNCINASECGTDTFCAVHTCTAGVCDLQYKPVGTVFPGGDQTTGDCKQAICDGVGNPTSMVDTGDLPTNTNECVAAACAADGTPSLTNKAVGTACSQNSGTRCDDTPVCVPTFMSVRIGDGSATLTSAATTVFIDERSETNGFVFGTVTIPSSNNTGVSPKSLTLSGTADSDGHLALSGDGHYVTLAGYNAPAGTPGVTGTATTGTGTLVPRIAARIDAAGNVDTTTTFGTAFNTDGVRSAVSNDGGQFWAGGNCSGSNCVRGVLYAVRNTSTSTLIESTSNSTRVCIIALGGLYCDANSGSRGVFTVGTGLPTTTATIATQANTGADSNASYFGLAVFDFTGPNNTPDGVADTIYVADERAPNALPTVSGGGIQKWTKSGTTWSLVDTFSNMLGSAGVRGLAAHTSSAGVVLIATTATASPVGNAILKYVDTGAAAATVLPTTLQAAGTNRVYRGVAVSPK